MSAKIDLLKKKIAGHKGWVTRSLNSCDKAIAKISDYNISIIERNAKSAEEYIESVKTTTGELLDIYLDAANTVDHDALETDLDAYIDMQESKLSDIYFVMNDFVKTAAATTVPPSATGGAAKTSSKTNPILPKIPTLKIPPFDGKDKMKFTGFWEQFLNGIDCLNMKPVFKLNNLFSLLTGDALAVIEGFALEDGNYDIAKERLVKTFGTKHKIKQMHMDALTTLEKPSYSADSLQSFLNKVNMHIRVLENNGTAINTYSAMLLNSLNSKVPPSVLKRLIEKSPEWALDQLFESIETEIDILERTQPHSTPDSSPNNAATVFHSGARPKHQQRQPGHNQRQPGSCTFCSQEHSIWNCVKFKTAKSRMEHAKQSHLCFNCLKANHSYPRCTNKSRCKHCNGKHHTLLCLKSDHNVRENSNVHMCSDQSAPGSETQQPEPSDSDTQTQESGLTLFPPGHTHAGITSHVESVNALTDTNSQVRLKTAQAYISHEKSAAIANILCDDGAQKTFISKSTANLLKAKVIGNQPLWISVFGSTKLVERHLDKVEINLSCIDRSFVKIVCFIVDHVSSPMHFYPINVSSYSEFRNLTFSHDVNFIGKFDLDLLIGSDQIGKITCNAKPTIFTDPEGLGPRAHDSRLGYLLAGPIPLSKSFKPSNLISTVITKVIVEPIDPIDCVKNLWSLDAVGITHPDDAPNEDFNVSDYVNSIKFNHDTQRYVAKLPFKNVCGTLPDNYNNCAQITRSVVRKLAKDNLLNKYSELINQQLDKGIIEKLDLDLTDASQIDGYVMPHHPVHRDSKTTPIRIVYNASYSCSKNCDSLNDCLEKGIALNTDLVNLLLNFRIGTYGIVSDIEKMFHMVEIHPDHRKFTRFLYLSDPSDHESNLSVFQFNRIPFGFRNSQFTLNCTVLKHLALNPCDISKSISDHLYIDNVIDTVNSVPDAINYFKTSREIFQLANFNLRCFASNCKELNDLAIAQNVAEDNLQSVKVLGLKWDTKTDKLSLNHLDLDNHDNISKRVILSLASKLYDPIGLMSPIVMKAKLFIQELWKLKLDWDMPLSKEYCDKWLLIKSDLEKASHYTFDRCIVGSSDSYKLYIFSDASQTSYAANIYLSDGINCNLLISKTRIAPVKKTSIPILELFAVVIACRIYKFVTSRLDIPISDTYVWLDSQCVLYWLLNSDDLKKYHKKRVNEILNVFDHKVFRYVPSKLNAADIATREISFNDLVNNTLWFNGPEFLLKDKSEWPTWELDKDINMSNITVNSAYVFNVHDSIDNCDTLPIDHIIDVDKFKCKVTLLKVLRVTAYVKRAFKKDAKKGPITVDELDDSRLAWIKACQSSSYRNEINLLNHKRINQLISQLDLFLDNDVLKSKGRIENANIPVSSKFPILLPHNHVFTRLLVLDIHQNLTLHSGINITMTEVRQTYWIPRLRQLVRKLLHVCVRCKLITGRAYASVKVPPLPELRVMNSRPYFICGCDYTGEFLILQSNLVDTLKSYVLLFTCANTRAIHLELVPDLSVYQFMLAFRRLSSRKSMPSVLISDNQSTFVSANENLIKLFKSLELVENLSNLNVKWVFIPKRSPWMNGFVERLIGVVKNVIKKVLRNSKLTFIELQSLLCRIECIVNNRPLTYVTSNLTDDDSVTPNKLIFGRNLTLCPYPSIDDDVLNDPDYVNNANKRSTLLERSKYRAMLSNKFESQWKSEYLTSLRQFHTCKGKSVNQVKVGDIVLIHNESKRLNWRLGLVIELNYGKDNLVRSVRLRTSSGYTNRPIIKLYPLEVNCDDVSKFNIPADDKPSTVNPVNDRPFRVAKDLANKRIALNFDSDSDSD